MMKYLFASIVFALLIMQPAFSAEVQLMSTDVPTVNGKANYFYARPGEIIFDTSDTTFYGNNSATSTPNWVQLSASSNPVTTSGSGENVGRVIVASNCTSSPCTITSQSGSWLTSISRTAAGTYNLNIASGFFSGVPTCVGNSTYMGTKQTAIDFVDYVGTDTATSVKFVTVDLGNNSAQDSGFEIHCMGPK